VDSRPATWAVLVAGSKGWPNYRHQVAGSLRTTRVASKIFSNFQFSYFAKLQQNYDFVKKHQISRIRNFAKLNYIYRTDQFPEGCHSLVPIDLCPLSTAHYLLPSSQCLLPTAQCPPFTANRPLPTVLYLLPQLFQKATVCM
jgi:hypothetical protein